MHPERAVHFFKLQEMFNFSSNSLVYIRLSKSTLTSTICSDSFSRTDSIQCSYFVSNFSKIISKCAWVSTYPYLVVEGGFVVLKSEVDDDDDAKFTFVLLVVVVVIKSPFFRMRSTDDDEAIDDDTKELRRLAVVVVVLVVVPARDGECAAPRVTFSKAKSCASFHESVENKEESKGENQTTTYNAHHRFTIHRVLFTHASNKYN